MLTLLAYNAAQKETNGGLIDFSSYLCTMGSSSWAVFPALLTGNLADVNPSKLFNLQRFTKLSQAISKTDKDYKLMAMQNYLHESIFPSSLQAITSKLKISKPYTLDKFISTPVFKTHTLPYPLFGTGIHHIHDYNQHLHHISHHKYCELSPYQFACPNFNIAISSNNTHCHFHRISPTFANAVCNDVQLTTLDHWTTWLNGASVAALSQHITSYSDNSNDFINKSPKTSSTMIESALTNWIHNEAHKQTDLPIAMFDPYGAKDKQQRNRHVSTKPYQCKKIKS
jgi:hypothetical protein